MKKLAEFILLFFSVMCILMIIGSVVFAFYAEWLLGVILCVLIIFVGSAMWADEYLKRH